MIWIRVFNKVEGVSGSSDFNLSLRINGQSLNWFKTSPRVEGGGEGERRLATDVTTSHNSVGKGEQAVLTLALDKC